VKLEAVLETWIPSLAPVFTSCRENKGILGEVDNSSDEEAIEGDDGDEDDGDSDDEDAILEVS